MVNNFSIIIYFINNFLKWNKKKTMFHLQNMQILLLQIGNKDNITQTFSTRRQGVLYENILSKVTY